MQPVTESQTDRVRDSRQSHTTSWLDLALGAALFVTFASTLVLLVWTDLFNLVFGTEPSAFILRDPDKAWLLTVWACAGILALAAAYLEKRSRLRGTGPTLHRAIAVLSSVGLALILVLAVRQDAAVKGLDLPWLGFGVLGIAFGLVLAAPIYFVLRYTGGRSRARAALILAIVVITVLSIGQLIQSPFTYASNWDQQFTFDEFIAPSTGRMPGFDYVAQYQTLLGYPLALVSLLFPAAFSANPENFAVVWVILLQVLTLALAITVVVRVAPRRIAWLAPLIVIPIAYLPGDFGLSYYAALPIRFVLPTVMLFLIVVLARRMERSGARWWMALAAGVAGGTALFNNPDHGAPAVLAGLAVVAAVAPSWRRLLAQCAIFVGGVLVTPAVVIAIGALTGREYQTRYAFFFANRFGVDGFYNVDADVVGLHTSFVALAVIGVILGLVGSRRLRGRSRVLHMALLFESTWMVFCLIYFSGRSLSATLITGYSFMAAVVVALLVVAAYPHVRLLVRMGWRTWCRREITIVVASALAIAIPVASYLTFPSAVEVFGRFDEAAEKNAAYSPFLYADPRIPLAKVDDDTDLMGILTVSGSTWSKRTGVTNVNLFLHPEYLYFIDAGGLECEYLQTLDGDTFVTTKYILDALSLSGVCTAAFDIEGAKTLIEAEGSVDKIEWLAVSRRE